MSHHQLSELYKSDDFKNEKHVPVIECDDQLKAGEANEIRVMVGKEIDHPNTTEHHIRWIKLYYLPEGATQVYELAKFEFSAHGESTKGANEGPAYTHHCGCACVKLATSGRIYATSYCNIHGLWESSKAVTVG